MNEYDEIGEQNYSPSSADILETGVLEGTGMTADLTEMEYEDVDWVHLFQDTTQRGTLVNMKMKLRRFGLRGENLQQMKLLTWIRANRHVSLCPRRRSTQTAHT